VDKLTLAAHEATLLHYLKGEAEREVPVWRMISMEEEELKRRADAWATQLREADITCEVVRGASAIGGGSLPGETLPTYLLSIQLGEQRAGEVAALLRAEFTPVIARVEAGALLVDPRTVLETEEQTLLASLSRVIERDA
jgi:L-seryl-tRNA(Ser) seleniumtransferase